VVLPKERAREVLERARERAAREAALRVRFAQGELSVDIYGLRQELREVLSKVERLRGGGDG
jgi:4-hydroxy-4-methyl-2-oxoglutarate aldolase